MGKKKSRNSGKTFKIIFIILSFILVIGLTGTIIFFNYNNKQLKKEIKKNNKILSKYNEDIENIILSNEDLIAEISFYENIDENIINMKNSYYSNMKELETQVINGTSSLKIAYLTFDDGPYYLTNSILDILDKYNVKATFFTIGLDKTWCFDNRAADCSRLYAIEASKGHTVANHTYSHLIWGGLYSSSNAFMNQVNTQANLIAERTGTNSHIVRFPGGSGTARSFNVFDGAVSLLRQNGYGWVDWTAQDGDGGNPGTSAQAFQTFKNSIDSKVEVVLLHDYSTVTYSILPQIIEYLQENGYVLLPLFYESAMVNK